MANELNLALTLTAFDNASKTVNQVKQQLGGLAGKIKETQQKLSNLQINQSNLEKVKKLRDENNNYIKSMGLLRSQIEQVKLAHENQGKTVQSVTAKHERATQKLEKYRTELARNAAAMKGIDSSKMSNAQFNIMQRGLKEESQRLKESIKAQELAVKSLKNEKTEAIKIAEQLKQSFERQKNTLQVQQGVYQKNTERLKELSSKLKSAGVNIGSLRSEENRLSSEIEKANKKLSNQQKLMNTIGKVKSGVRNYSSKIQTGIRSGLYAQTMGQQILNPVMRAGQGVVGMAKVAGQFEQFQSILEVTEGSSEKAKASFEWVKKFAVDTPANLDEAMEAFVRLRAYGMDPTNGLLQTLGDTGAAMGKPVMQAVEAIADAVTGENERLKEFGIKGRAVKGSNIIEYEYTDKNGKQQLAKVDKTNRKQIEQTLSRIFNEKYASAMEKQSKTLMGVWAKLEDQWTNFQMQIMQTGAFDWIKEKLQGILTALDKMQQNGELKQWAEDIGAIIKEVIQGFWDFGQSIMGTIKFLAKFARENKGVIATLIKYVAMIGMVLSVSAPFIIVLSSIAPIVSTLGKTFWWVGSRIISIIRMIGVAMWANPILAIIALIIGALALLWYNWDSVCAWIKEKWQWLSLQASQIWTRISTNLSQAWENAKNKANEIWQAVSNFFAQSWEDIKGFFSNALNQIITKISQWSPLQAIKGVFQSVLDYFGIELPERFLNFGSMLMDNLTNGIKNGLNTVKETISNVGANTLNWFKEKLGISTEQTPTQNAIQHANLIKDSVSGTMIKVGNVPTVKGQASGGYVGNGGKYQPMGVVHGGEYVMTKEATSRLGVSALNALNYGKQALVAGGLGLTMATAMATPIQIDNRPPLTATQPQAQVAPQPMQININIHPTANQDPQAIAKEVARQLALLENKRQARLRSRLSDRG